ncbi:GNAT family N-acetyltransferase [Thermomonas sp.]|uniref:GNAT family N-acetyltransferase n=1 Tax=Thermomonas sp. TaxID=1971895 RepID=UPI002487AE44|nr:GNAT family N-acetyltransferase [Thermomonas sp.]MDI1252321.1 GNAT family N-acetyltransferase [Thermomonas sp.]
MDLRTNNITLIVSTLAHIRIELETPELLGELLCATVSSEWPSGEYDRDAMEFFRTCFEEGGKAAEGWYGWYAIRDADETSPSTLVGAAGYFGPPDANGTVEIGYSVLPEWQRNGYATQMTDALVKNVFSMPHVERVIAHTTEENPASIAILVRCSFAATGSGREPGTVRFECTRPSV